MPGRPSRGPTHVVRLLARVDANVALEGLEVAEASSTSGARVGLLPRVDQHVRTQMRHLEGGALTTGLGVGPTPQPQPRPARPAPLLGNLASVGSRPAGPPTCTKREPQVSHL